MRSELDNDALAVAMVRIQARKSTRRPTIFVAHIDDGLRDQLKDELLARGCDVIEAADGVAALEQLAMAADGVCPWPDVLVLPALGLLLELQDLPERPPTLLVVARPANPIDVVATRLGAYRVFHQPVELLEVVNSILDAARDRRAQRCGSSSEGAQV